jgi:hypothetical protein
MKRSVMPEIMDRLIPDFAALHPGYFGFEDDGNGRLFHARGAGNNLGLLQTPPHACMEHARSFLART